MHDRASLRQESLLIVDDDPIGREALRRGLERRGFTVTEIGDGHQALMLLNSTRFDLILLDVEMPGIDGLNVLRTIRTIYAITDLPVIMITAKGESHDIVRALQMGANDYITKPLELGVVAARVETQLSLNRTAHLLAVFRAQFQDCLQHFFPGSSLVTLLPEEPVRWGERPAQANYRLGEMENRHGIGIEWLRLRYCFTPRMGTLTAAERKLVEVLTQVLDIRYRAMFDLEMPNRLELVHYPVEDWVVAESLWPQNVVPVLEALKLLRVAALLTYENRKLSTGILLTSDEGDVLSAVESDAELPRLGSWLFQVKSLQRLCDGLHTLFVVDSLGRMQGVTEIGMWGGGSADAALPGPCPRAYARHAQATLGGKNICLVLTPSQEIRVFAGGTQGFVFRGARWHLLDIPAKFTDWQRRLNGISCEALPELIFQSAMDLADARHGALFVILDRPQESLPQLVATEKQLHESSTAAAAGSRVLERLLLHTLCGADATRLGSRIFQALATIDGALVLDTAGHLLAAGAILRVAMDETGKEQVLEGARSTAASVASRHGLVLKVSEDGLVTCFQEGEPVWLF